MSRQVLKIAVEIGLSRRRFLNKEAAEGYFENLKLEVFELVDSLKSEYPNEILDYSPDSLKSIAPNGGATKKGLPRKKATTL